MSEGIATHVCFVKIALVLATTTYHDESHTTVLIYESHSSLQLPLSPAGYNGTSDSLVGQSPDDDRGARTNISQYGLRQAKWQFRYGDG
jgi:hypothetical protein